MLDVSCLEIAFGAAIISIVLVVLAVVKWLKPKH